MSEESKGSDGSEALFSTWMKTANDFWGSLIKTWPVFSPSLEKVPSTEKDDQAQGKTEDAEESLQKFWQIFFPFLENPVLAEAMSKGIPSLPETVAQVARVAFEGHANLQKQWLDRMGRTETPPEAAPKAGDGEQEPFKTWMAFYEKEFRKYFTMPPLGLTRFYQERLAQAMDQFNLYQAALNDFFHLLYQPLEKSNQGLQEKLTTLAEEGKAPEKFQDYYHLWLNILEGHYQTLFKSTEFTKILAETLQATENFMEAKQAILQDLMQLLPVPTHKDMEELYRELYLLKKKVSELEKKLADSQKEKKAPRKATRSPKGDGSHESG